MSAPEKQSFDEFLAKDLPAELPHGVRGLMEYPYDPFWMWLGVVILGALACLGLWFWVIGPWWRRRKARAMATEPVLQRVLRELRELRPSGGQLEDPRMLGDFYDRLSWLLREYLEEVSKLPVTDWTHRELREPLRSKLNLPQHEVQDLLSFLERADFVKFAKQRVTFTQAESDYDRVQTWVSLLMTKEQQP